MSVAVHSRPPRSFTTKPLGEVFDVVGGGTPPKNNASYFSGDIPWATIRDMHSDVLAETEHTISQEGLRHSSAKLIPAGEVIMASRVGLGKACILQRDTAINQDIRALLPLKPKTVDRRFCLYWLQSVKDDIIAAGTGATVQGIKLPFIKSLPFPDVPFEEQKRIVAALDQAFAALDRARALAEANLADAKAMFEIAARSIFSEDAVRNAATKLVSELAQKRKGAMRTGPFGSDLRHSEFVDKGVKVLGIDNAVQNRFVDGKPRYITEEKYAELKRYQVFPGDVIITIMGTCGRCAVIPDDIPVSINTKHLCCISLDQAQCLPSFLHRYFLLSPRAREYLEGNAKGSVMDGLNLGLIKDLPVQLPSLSEQRRICAKIEALEMSAQALAASFQSKIQELNALHEAILEKAFAGELT